LIASTFSPEETLGLLESYEPNVPWVREFLEVRADVYGKLGNPLAAKARADLARFIKNELTQP
jgi:hypothetical protein